MAVDIACVGFGPAMGGFLTTLSRSLLNAGWIGAAGKCNVPRLASAGNLLRARRRAGLWSLGRGHACAWDTRQFSRRGSHRDSDGGGGEEGETRLPARSTAGEPTIIFLSRLGTACCARSASSSG